MENKKKNDTAAPRQLNSDDLTLIVGSVEDAAILIRDLLDDYFLRDFDGKQEGVRAIMQDWEFSRARAWATSIEFQVGYVLRELQALGASR